MLTAGRCTAQPSARPAAVGVRAPSHRRPTVAAAAATPADDPATSRRAALAGLVLSASAALTRPAAADSEEGAVAAVADPQPPPPPPPPPPLDATFARLADATLAYEFDYPTAASGLAIPLVPSRRPERYSSAAPLSADARQRIVCELISLAQGVTVSVTVGPASGVLKGVDPAAWTARQVAATVLADRSTARVTGGQRIALNAIESAARVARGAPAGGDFFVYEHLSQGSPSERSLGVRETYRHAWAATGVRAGAGGEPYLYTLNLSCPQDLWPKLGPAFAVAAASFALPPPGKGYVPPDAQPWRFF